MKLSHASAVAGAAVWLAVSILAATGLAGMGWIEILFLLAPLVLVPLALRLCEPFLSPSPLLRAVSAAQLLAAILAALSFFLPPGVAAGALAAPWGIVTGLIALAGLMNVRSLLRPDLSRLLVAAAMLFIPVGGVHLVASRMGIALMGFPEPIILLTAVHFHYTAFVAPILAALAARTAGGPARAGGFGILVATPLLAAGFVFAPVLKLVAALLLVISVALLAVAQLLAVRKLRHPASRLLLAVSAMCVIAGMALAAVYELGFFTGRAWIGIPRMAQTHGILNGIGFTLCGLLGWKVNENDGRFR